MLHQRLRVRGQVQGVGFRPFVHRLATELSLAGWVGNDLEGVVVEIAGAEDRVAGFRRRLVSDAPPLARVAAVVDEAVADGDAPSGSFTIRASDEHGAHRAVVAPDAATCPRCRAEVFDPGDRRHGHALASCTDCGPRLSIARDVPWDRPRTSMAPFPMCPACQHEYDDPADRRFHAQPNCCPDCGPRLSFVPTHGEAVGASAAVSAAAEVLARGGSCIAVKGLGGWHLACPADDEAAVRRLRRFKARPDRPFAVMVADEDAARALVVLGDVAGALLASPGAPIVLAPVAPTAAIAPGVAPGLDRLGVLLANTPLHHLLLAEVGRPLVLTSANRSGRPIVVDDDEARSSLGSEVDGLLGHDRPIVQAVEDSVATVVDGAVTILRRSRGWAPAGLALPVAARRPVLAVGAQQKHTFALARGAVVHASPHQGDLGSWEAEQAMLAALDRHRRLLGIEPEVVAHDLHPQYASSRVALELDLPAVAVQHHHAHVASCLVDHGRSGPVIGVAFDGTGYGIDGALWGGEVLVADLHDATRVAHLGEAVLPGGELAVREPWRMAVAHLQAAGVEAPDAFVRRHADRWEQVVEVVRGGLSPRTTSVGRLFDAAAALLGVRDVVSWDGQAPAELEALARQWHEADASLQPVGPPGDGDAGPSPGGEVLDAGALVRELVAGIAAGRSPAELAHRFHLAVVGLVRTGCARARDEHGLGTVALTGGVFQNVLLSSACRRALEADGFEVLVHREVPPNDAGISIGQAAVAAARDA